MTNENLVDFTTYREQRNSQFPLYEESNDLCHEIKRLIERLQGILKK